MAGADFRAAFVASCFLGALPPVDFRAVCFVRAISNDQEKHFLGKTKENMELKGALMKCDLNHDLTKYMGEIFRRLEGANREILEPYENISRKKRNRRWI